MPRHDDYAVIVNADYAVLLVKAVLPCIPDNQTHFWQTCEPVNQAVLRHYGLTVTTVRCLRVDYAEGQVTNVYLMEYHDGGLPPDSAWVPAGDLPALPAPVSRDDLPTWLGWLRSDHPNRPTWYRPGFQRDTLARFAGQTNLRIEQIRSWERSHVARVISPEGIRYLKTVPVMFAHEPALTGWLHSHDPNPYPAVLSITPGRDMLTAAYEGQPLIERPELPLWQKALTQYAALQTGLIAHAGTLRGLGVPQRGLDWIGSHLDEFLADDAALTSGTRPLSPDEIRRLRDLTPCFHQACQKLAQFAVPPSLEHGDLWTGQIIVRPDGSFLFTDWSDSAITHPFFSLLFFLAEVDNELPGVTDARQHLTDAYLQPWADFESPARLREALGCAGLLSPMYTVLRYAFDILPRMEMHWEMENMLAYNLRLALESLS